jgi:hypothetical protein
LARIYGRSCGDTCCEKIPLSFYEVFSSYPWSPLSSTRTHTVIQTSRCCCTDGSWCEDCIDGTSRWQKEKPTIILWCHDRLSKFKTSSCINAW